MLSRSKHLYNPVQRRSRLRLSTLLSPPPFPEDAKILFPAQKLLPLLRVPECDSHHVPRLLNRLRLPTVVVNTTPQNSTLIYYKKDLSNFHIPLHFESSKANSHVKPSPLAHISTPQNSTLIYYKQYLSNFHIPLHFESFKSNSHVKLCDASHLSHIMAESRGAHGLISGFRFSVFATIKVIILDTLRSAVNISGTVVARYGNNKQYCLSDDVMNHLEYTLFDRPANQASRADLWRPIELSRNVVAVPAYSSLVISADLRACKYEIAKGFAEFFAEDSGQVTKLIEAENGYVVVDVSWSSVNPCLYGHSTDTVHTGFGDQKHPQALCPWELAYLSSEALDLGRVTRSVPAPCFTHSQNMSKKVVRHITYFIPTFFNPTSFTLLCSSSFYSFGFPSSSRLLISSYSPRSGASSLISRYHLSTSTILPVLRLYLSAISLDDEYSVFMALLEESVGVQVIGKTKFRVAGQIPHYSDFSIEFSMGPLTSMLSFRMWREDLCMYGLDIESEGWLQCQASENVYGVIEGVTDVLPYGVAYSETFDSLETLGPYVLYDALCYLVKYPRHVRAKEAFIKEAFMVVVLHVCELLSCTLIREEIQKSMARMTPCTFTDEQKAVIKNWSSLSKFILKQMWNMEKKDFCHIKYLTKYSLDVDIDLAVHVSGIVKITSKSKLD